MKCQQQHKLLIHMICHSIRVHRPSLCILPFYHVGRPVTWVNTPLKEAECYYFSNYRHRMSQIFLYPSNQNNSSSNTAMACVIALILTTNDVKLCFFCLKRWCTDLHVNLNSKGDLSNTAARRRSPVHSVALF